MAEATQAPDVVDTTPITEEEVEREIDRLSRAG